MTAVIRRFKALLLLVVAPVLLSGCDFDVYQLPLPGGTDVGDNPMTVTVMFEDVLDLVPKSTVKVNDVSVGNVSDVQLDGYVAEVTLELQEDVELPDDAIAQIRQTSLLGEKFVSLSPPPEGGSDEPLESGDTIPLERSGRNPEVEEVLGALSLLLNGGGVGQLQTINRELNNALEGREDSARSVLRQIEILMGQLDENKADIVNAIEALNRLAISVNDQQGTIEATLDELPSALDSLDRQRNDLVKMLRALNRLGDVGVRVIRASKQSTIESFRQLTPVLTELANTGDNFAKSFHVFLTYPFVDEVVGRDPQVARNLHMGDYTNLSVELDLRVPGLSEPNPTPPTNLPPILDPGQTISLVVRCLRSGDITSKPCRQVLNRPRRLLELQEECRKQQNRDRDVCRQLNALPGLPLPSGGGAGLPDLPGLPDLGLPRAGFGSSTDDRSARGPTMKELMQLYDPSLVALLVPGMVTR
jgi:phospholipid/cholesterol/gamma-HCH transport system substrate-binding protein